MAACLLLLAPTWTLAQVQVSTSAVLIPKGQQETTIDLKNDGHEEVLLYSKISKLPDDDLAGGVLYTVPQTVVVPAGATQTVRVIYRNNRPLDREHMARVLFSGMPPIEQRQFGKVKLVVGQDLPVVIGVDPTTQEADLWKKVVFAQEAGKLCLSNPSRKIFRFDPDMSTRTPATTLAFDKAYLLPGERLCQTLPSPLPEGTKLTFESVSSFNFRMQSHEVSLPAARPAT